jgi:phage baseplate assembly protein V
LVRAIQKITAPLARRISLMIGRGIVRLVNNAGGRQLLQVSLLADEVRDNVERFQNYGMASFPFPGAEVVAGSVGGSRDHLIVLVVDDRRYKIELVEGEVALYDDLDQKVHLTRSGIEVESPTKITATAPLVDIVASSKVTVTTPEVDIIASTKVALTTPLVTMSGNLVVTGNVAAANVTAVTTIADANGAKTMAGMRTTYNTHHHSTGPAPTEQM